jgi:hypothetical protein
MGREMLNFLSRNRVLAKLDVQSLFVTRDGLESIVSCPNLKELTLGYRNELGVSKKSEISGYDVPTPARIIEILNTSQLASSLILTIHTTSSPNDSFDALLLRFPNTRIIKH